MNDESKLLNELSGMLTQFEEQKQIIYNNYVKMAALVLNGEITAENEIEKIMDGLMDFGDDEHFLELYKKLCRYVYNFFPRMVNEHVKMFLKIYGEKGTV